MMKLRPFLLAYAAVLGLAAWYGFAVGAFIPALSVTLVGGGVAVIAVSIKEIS